MENSLNSSSPDPSVSDLRSVFKRPTNISQAFDVSLNESVPYAKENKSDLNTTDSGNAEKVLQFQKKRKSHQFFNVDSCDSINTSGLEESVTFVKPKPVLSKKNKNKTLNDFFNVSFNETNTSVQLQQSICTDDSNIFSKNIIPFKIGNKSHKEVLVMQHNESGSEVPVDENESTIFVTKQNPFLKDNSLTHLQLSVTEEDQSRNKTVENQNRVSDFKLNDEADTTNMKTKINPFEQANSSQTGNAISVSAEISNCSEPKQTSKNITIDRSVSQLTNNSVSCFEQSSINDENLNNWMSDQSEEEVAPPETPRMAENLSHTKEKLPVLGSPTETNQLSNWKQKFGEIVSNAEKKFTHTKLKHNSPTKKKCYRKPVPPGEKPDKPKPVKLIRPAPFATKQLYEHIIKKLKPKYGIDTMIEAENLVLSICDTVKRVTRKKIHQKKLIQSLKNEMAKTGLIETTWDFYEFVIKFLPYSFRIKVVPCVQPVTNLVYPPKDVVNPFEKIL